MKRNFITILLLCITSIFCSDFDNRQQEEDFALLQEAIEIVASMSDNIANLAIQYKTDTNSPELTKQECVALIEKITAFVVTILKKQKLKKSCRKITLYNSDNFHEQIDELAQQIVSEVQKGY